MTLYNDYPRDASWGRLADLRADMQMAFNRLDERDKVVLLDCAYGATAAEIARRFYGKDAKPWNGVNLRQRAFTRLVLAINAWPDGTPYSSDEEAMYNLYEAVAEIPWGDKEEAE